jgi:putative membrane protein
MNINLEKLLLILYGLLFTVLAINPYDRATWIAENLPVVIVVIILVLWHKHFVFSRTSYLLMWVFLCYHTIGGHWTFERVPFEYGNQLISYLGLDFVFPEGRNNFDRIGHFFVGVFAYPIVEYMLRTGQVTHKITALLFAVFAIGFWAASYEIIEMVYAIKEGGSSGAAFLGSQGDIWDAQKDMFLDICGSILFGILATFRVAYKGK